MSHNAERAHNYLRLGIWATDAEMASVSPLWLLAAVVGVVGLVAVLGWLILR
jgi:hypothetical protein